MMMLRFPLYSLVYEAVNHFSRSTAAPPPIFLTRVVSGPVVLELYCKSTDERSISRLYLSIIHVRSKVLSYSSQDFSECLVLSVEKFACEKDLLLDTRWFKWMLHLNLLLDLCDGSIKLKFQVYVGNLFLWHLEMDLDPLFRMMTLLGLKDVFLFHKG